MSETTPEYTTYGEFSAARDVCGKAAVEGLMGELSFADHLKSMIAMLRIFRDCVEAEVPCCCDDGYEEHVRRPDLRDVFFQVQDLIWMLHSVSQ